MRRRDNKISESMRQFSSEKNWVLRGTWGREALTLEDFNRTMHRYVDALQRIHRDYQSLLFLGNGSAASTRLTENLSNLRDCIFANSCYPDPPTRSAYSHKDAAGLPTAETSGMMGFSVWLADDLYVSSKGGLLLKVTAGSNGSTLNGFQLEYLHPTRHDMMDLALQEGLLQATVDHWPLEHAALTSRALVKKLNIDPDSRTPCLDVGWITYSRNSMRGAVVPEGVTHKPFGPNGVLITAMDHEPSPDDEEDVNRLKMIRDKWRDHDLLSMTWDE